MRLMLPSAWSFATKKTLFMSSTSATSSTSSTIRNTASVSRRLASSSPASTTALLASTRGQEAVGLLPSYLADARSVVRYSPQTPDGALQLGVAESLMLEDWLVPALNRPIEGGVKGDAIYYQPTQGRDDFLQSMAAYLEDLLQLPAQRLKPGNLIVGAGCNAVLENLCFALADAGESVLIPTPYYAAFEFDLVARAGLRVESVATKAYQTKHIPDDSSNPQPYFPNAAALDAAYERCVNAGSSPQILLLSHPNNPLGICYPPFVMEECIQWCRDRKVHLISDEIYAGSVYRAEDSGFQSALRLADTPNGLGPYVHWVYALSKDFALSGLRVGAAYTENPEILLPMQKLNDLCQISSLTQLWTKMMMDHSMEDSGGSWVQAFRKVNHSRLEARSTQVTAVLDEFQIPFLTPTAGLFVWMDLSQYLPTNVDTAAEQERHLYLELVQEYGLLLTPGLSMRNESPGFFRCVFTAATEDEFQLSLERLRKFGTKKASS